MNYPENQTDWVLLISGFSRTPSVCYNQGMSKRIRQPISGGEKLVGQKLPNKTRLSRAEVLDPQEWEVTVSRILSDRLWSRSLNARKKTSLAGLMNLTVYLMAISSLNFFIYI